MPLPNLLELESLRDYGCAQDPWIAPVFLVPELLGTGGEPDPVPNWLCLSSTALRLNGTPGAGGVSFGGLGDLRLDLVWTWGWNPAFVRAVRNP